MRKKNTLNMNNVNTLQILYGGKYLELYNQVDPSLNTNTAT